MTNVTILGAGGNMGRRITRTLRDNARYQLQLVDPAAEGRARIADSGLGWTEPEQAIPAADVVIFAVPDKLIRTVAAEVVPQLAPAASILFLDPAAVAAHCVPRRDDVNCFVTHPTHPPLYGLLAEDEPAARRDYWGGGLATQAIVFATAWGDETVADQIQELAVAMFAPISQAYRITVEQMALLEPALTETLTNGCIDVIKEGLDKVIERGVPADAATAFLMGHLQIGIALIFEQLDWKLSDGAQLALENSRKALFRPDWDAIFEPANVGASLRMITGSE